MSYDFDSASDRDPPRVSTPPMHSTDLEAIVTLLDLAAIYLTPSPNTLFSFEALLAQAREISGPDLVLAERDVRIVLPFMKTIRKRGRKFFLA
jgi:hypothetical protein